ncbi:MAG: SGNH/GDSL hydrolase family protein [Pirellulales bacterium]
MNPILLSFADGTSFFVGLAMVLVADLLLLRFRVRGLRAVLTALALTGTIFVVISATPLSLWAYGAWLAAAMAALVVGSSATSSRRRRIAAALAVLVVTAGLCSAEIPHHILPRVTVPTGTTIYVVGDSISAGVGTKDHCWPTVLNEITGFSVVNLAEAGATVRSAGKQVKRIPKPHAVVVLEIGGNDLLGGTDATTFRSQLAALVCSLRSDQHQVLMVELPLFPFQNAFGSAQRDVAAEYGVAMLPKRCLTRVLGTTNGTLDGLHLSQEGHDAMAEIVREVLDREASGGH